MTALCGRPLTFGDPEQIAALRRLRGPRVVPAPGDTPWELEREARLRARHAAHPALRAGLRFGDPEQIRVLRQWRIELGYLWTDGGGPRMFEVEYRVVETRRARVVAMDPDEAEDLVRDHDDVDEIEDIEDLGPTDREPGWMEVR